MDKKTLNNNGSLTMFNSTTTNMNMKRAKAQDLQLKLQLPEIMQQQQAKLNSLKKQHEARFKADKRNDPFAQTRSRSFNQTFQDPFGGHFGAGAMAGPQGVIVQGVKHGRAGNLSPNGQN